MRARLPLPLPSRTERCFSLHRRGASGLLGGSSKSPVPPPSCSAAEKAGFSLSKIEKLGLLSTAERLGLLSLLDELLVTDPGKVRSSPLLYL